MVSSEEPPAWHRSRACTGGPACVEIALLEDGGVLIRDSKIAQGPQLQFSGESWNEFMVGVHAGEFARAVPAI